MENESIIVELEQIQARLLKQEHTLRPKCRPERLEKQRAALVIGARGVGKTTLLIESIRDQQILYLSADHPVLAGTSLWEISKTAFQLGYKGIAVDEVHFLNDWSQDLKAIYDSYPEKKIWASDSSSIILRKGLSDLSRRFPKVDVPLLSLREYMFMNGEREASPFDAMSNNSKEFLDINQTQILSYFRSYLSSGLRPFFLEGSYPEKILNVIEKTIFTDVPFFLPQVQEKYLRLMNAIIGHLAHSSIPTLNIDQLSGKWSIGKEKLYELLSTLEHLGLINIIRYKNDHKASGKGAKIFLADPSMYAVLAGNKGNQREAFFVTMVKSAGKSVYAAKDDSKYDFLVDDLTVEIGGASKSRKQAEIVVRDDIENVSRNAIPLWSMGFLY